MANQDLTVRQAQYLINKWKAEAAATYTAQNGGILTNGVITGGTLTLSTAADKSAWRTALGIENSATDKNGSSTNVSNNTDTTIANTGTLSAGTYIIHAKCQFATNTTGYRMLYLAASNTGGFIDRYARVIQAPASGTYTEIDLTYLTTISSNTTFYVRVKHTANTTLSCVGGIQFIKIH